MKRSLISEPKVLVTGVEGAGKTLFAIEQAYLLSQSEGGDIFQLNIRGADPAHLPRLPFDLSEMALRDGKPVIDPETGDQLPRWAVDLEPGSVVIVDEAHKVYPQRGPGRPPKHIEMLAEGRQHGIRFIYLSQQPESIDSFVRGRINRHYHLERKGNLDRATVLEFDHLVLYPTTAYQDRKRAVVHFWKYPKQFYGWYTSAKSHHFRLRIPLKIVAALLFVPVAAYFLWSMFHKVSPFFHGSTLASAALHQGASTSVPSVGSPMRGDSEGGKRAVRYETITDYSRQFAGFTPAMPFTAPAFRTREVVSNPEVFCMASAAGSDALGAERGSSCSCISEQGTKVEMVAKLCRAVAAQGGVYNPYREPIEHGERSGDDSGFSRASSSSSVVAAFDDSSHVQGGNAQPFGTLPGYGALGVK